MTKVLIADAVNVVCAERLRESCEVIEKPGLDEAGLIEAVAGVDAMVVRSGVRVTEAVIRGADSLRVIGRAGAGVDTIDVEAATRAGIIVMNTPGGNSVSTAEHTIALLFSCARNIAESDRSVRAGGWDRRRFVGTELRGKILGIVGLGKVGREVARIAEAIGMRVLAHDPFLAESESPPLIELDRLFAVSDFVTLHSPLTESTRHLVNEERLASMKPSARLINCARGGLVDEAALAEAISSGRILGAAVDVYSSEPPTGNPLLEIDAITTTPHLGASTREAQVQVAVQIAEQIEAWARDGSVVNAVNFPSLGGEAASRMAPYLDLAENLGSLAAQLLTGAPTELVVEIRGELLEIDSRPLLASAAKGMLDTMLAEPANLVSAAALARDRGIELKEIRSSEAEDFSALISVKASAETDSHSASGALFGRKERRLVGLDGMRFDAALQGPMLLIENVDQPGVVGVLGTILGERGVNIAAMSLCRAADGARTLLNLDAAASDPLVQELETRPEFGAVRALRIKGDPVRPN
ncbi:MAG: phosphoglycerate dehydrogenase [Gemmatimonadetes bacterium]|nr:phosphoglycerate dehydrogenase [Gemmatimonadota bacterium]